MGDEIELNATTYISKEPSKEDGRSFYVLPTNKAFELTAQFNTKQAECLKAFEAVLGKDCFDELVWLLNTALSKLESIKEK